MVPKRAGAWYPPTVLTDVEPGVPSYSEEVFGPVASIIEARDEADAVRIANDSEFGLGSGVITGDPARGERIAAELIEAGMSYVNTNVASDPRMPFGASKHSSNGRECGAFGIHEFVNVKRAGGGVGLRPCFDKLSMRGRVAAAASFAGPSFVLTLRPVEGRGDATDCDVAARKYTFTPYPIRCCARLGSFGQTLLPQTSPPSGLTRGSGVPLPNRLRT